MGLIDFDWDDDNVSHIAKHDVTPQEAGEVLCSDPLEMGFEVTEEGEERWSYLGETALSRLLYVVITVRGERVRVVTAFNAEKQERLFYLKTKAGLKDGAEGS